MPLVSVIASGNCAVVKPSEVAPHASLKLKQLILRNLDGDSYRAIEGLVEVAKALTNAPFDGICFTGSTEKGRLVATAAGKNLVPCVLELGGKCPVIVDESANLDFAAKEIARARFMNCGQTCVATDYVLLHYSVTDSFVRLLEKEIRTQWSDGANVNDMGKVINAFHTDRIKSLLKNH
jgi:aldehyde dehydrogenase (NAD+)